MGARGPAPTPTTILEARGSWLPKTRAGEPRLPVERPSCPAWLSREAKAEWRRQVKELARMGVLARVDRGQLAVYCEAWGEFVEVCEQLRQTGRLLKAKKSDVVYTNPLISIRNRAVERLIRLADRFGFSPAARARVQSEGQQTEEAAADGKARFFAASEN